jgi:hypothetical protein
MKQINWGVLGTANIAKGHTIPAMLKANNCKLYGISGRNTEKVDEFQETFGFEKAYYSYDALLDDEAIEAVYIPLPNTLHKEWVLKAAAKKNSYNIDGSIKYYIHVNGITDEVTVEVPNNYTLEVEQLGRCITDKEEPYVSHEFSIKNARTMDKVLASMGY